MNLTTILPRFEHADPWTWGVLAILGIGTYLGATFVAQVYSRRVFIVLALLWPCLLVALIAVFAHPVLAAFVALVWAPNVAGMVLDLWLMSRPRMAWLRWLARPVFYGAAMVGLFLLIGEAVSWLLTIAAGLTIGWLSIGVTAIRRRFPYGMGPTYGIRVEAPTNR